MAYDGTVTQGKPSLLDLCEPVYVTLAVAGCSTDCVDPITGIWKGLSGAISKRFTAVHCIAAQVSSLARRVNHTGLSIHLDNRSQCTSREDSGVKVSARRFASITTIVSQIDFEFMLVNHIADVHRSLHNFCPRKSLAFTQSTPELTTSLFSVMITIATSLHSFRLVAVRLFRSTQHIATSFFR
jgi:hypothetical protein